MPQFPSIPDAGRLAPLRWQVPGAPEPGGKGQSPAKAARWSFLCTKTSVLCEGGGLVGCGGRGEEMTMSVLCVLLVAATNSPPPVTLM